MAVIKKKFANDLQITTILFMATVHRIQIEAANPGDLNFYSNSSC